MSLNPLFPGHMASIQPLGHWASDWAGKFLGLYECFDFCRKSIETTKAKSVLPVRKKKIFTKNLVTFISLMTTQHKADCDFTQFPLWKPDPKYCFFTVNSLVLPVTSGSLHLDSKDVRICMLQWKQSDFVPLKGSGQCSDIRRVSLVWCLSRTLLRCLNSTQLCPSPHSLRQRALPMSTTHRSLQSSHTRWHPCSRCQLLSPLAVYRTNRYIGIRLFRLNLIPIRKYLFIFILHAILHVLI